MLELRSLLIICTHATYFDSYSRSDGPKNMLDQFIGLVVLIKLRTFRYVHDNGDQTEKRRNECVCAVYNISPFFSFVTIIIIYCNYNIITRVPSPARVFHSARALTTHYYYYSHNVKKNCDHNATRAGTERNINYYGWSDEISFCKRSWSHGFLAFVTGQSIYSTLQWQTKKTT